MKKNIFFIICMIFNYNHAEHFIYPVAALEDSNELLLIYQKSLYDIELWLWQIDQHCATKCLSSFLIPANLQLLPSKKGFSFIDAGYIKIKEFSKRSSKTLPIYDPIGLFSNIHWIDDNTFYFVAREGDFFQIFQSDLQAHIDRLTYDMTDSLYPQKIESQLFYIQRNEDRQNLIMRKKYKKIANTNNFNNSQDQDIIVESSQNQLCFLKMISLCEGFYLQAPTEKRLDDEFYIFTCFHFMQINGTWHNEQLFDFKIPIKYITGLDRLYESIEPFLPNYSSKGLVFFVNWEKEIEQFFILKFDMQTKTIEIVMDQFKYQNQKIFAPFLYKNKIFCGLITKDLENYNEYFKDGNAYFELPWFDKNNKC